MQLPTFILALLAIMASSVLAAECFSNGGTSTCLPKAYLYEAVTDYCTWTTSQPRKVYVDGATGWQGTIEGSYLDSQGQECFSALNNIVDQCAGHKDGGSWTLGDFSMKFDFCNAIA